MDAVYHSLETSVLAVGFALSLAAFAWLANPPKPSADILLPMLTVDIPRDAR